jgi:hypothetical protein
MFSETHSAQRDMLIQDIIARISTTDGGASSQPVRRIVQVRPGPDRTLPVKRFSAPRPSPRHSPVRAERGKTMTELLITVSALLLASIGCAVLHRQSLSGNIEAAVADEQTRRMQAIAFSVF